MKRAERSAMLWEQRNPVIPGGRFKVGDPVRWLPPQLDAPMRGQIATVTRERWEVRRATPRAPALYGVPLRFPDGSESSCLENELEPVPDWAQ